MTVSKRIAVGTAVVAVCIVVWSTLIEPRFWLDTQRVEAVVPNLPPEWDGATIALLSDFQIGMWGGNTAMVRRAIREAIKEQPRVVLIAGDFLYKPDSAEVVRAADLMAPFAEARLPVLAVLGNHDYSLGTEDSEINQVMPRFLVNALRPYGVKVLDNASLETDGLTFVGIGSLWAEEADWQRALEDVPASAPRIIISHNPTVFRDLPAGQAPLMLAGHTHGGQIRILPGERRSWLDIVKEGEVVADGWAADTIGAAGNHLYVTRGIGFSTVPTRFNCPPELTLVTLRRAR